MSEYIVLLGLIIISSLIGNLKNISLVTGGSGMRYIMMILDSLTYILVLKEVVTDSNWYSIALFVVGRTIAVYLTDRMVDKIYSKEYLMNLYINEDQIEKLDEFFLSQNYSYTLKQGYFRNMDRYYVTLHLSKTQLSDVRSYFKKNKVKPNYDLTEVTTFGKISERIE